MTTKPPPNRRKFSSLGDEIDYLYHKLLYWFYDRADVRKAFPFAGRLERLLRKAPAGPESVRAEECRSLIAELQGDWLCAIRHREKEIRLIRQLQEFARDTDTRDAVLRHYDYGDLSDRLDLLATLYHARGDLDRAIKILRESRALCEEHRIPFDGQDLLDDYQAERKERSRAG